MKRRLNILSILVFIVLGLSLYTTGYQFGTGMKAGMSLAKEQHKESKACDRPMLAGDFRFCGCRTYDRHDQTGYDHQCPKQ